MNDVIDIDNLPNLQRRIEHGWNTLRDFLNTLSEEQLTKRTDAAGWTVKDHLAHIASWEDGLYAILAGQSLPEAMQVDQASWQRGEEAINAALQQRYQHVPINEVLQILRQNHERVMDKINTLTDEDLLRSYQIHQPISDNQRLIISWIVDNTCGHYEEHIPWMAAIAGR